LATSSPAMKSSNRSAISGASGRLLARGENDFG